MTTPTQVVQQRADGSPEVEDWRPAFLADVRQEARALAADLQQYNAFAEMHRHVHQWLVDHEVSG